MNKKSKQLVSGAAIALAIAGVGSNVHADETQVSTATPAPEAQTQTQETVETAKAAADTAQVTATQAQDAVTAQQANVAAAQNTVNTAQADAAAADKTYQQSQTDAATSTPETIAQQQSAVDTAEKDVNAANQQVNEATVKVAQAEQQDKERQAKIADAKANLDKVATADTKQAVKDSSDAEAEAKAAQAEATKQAALKTAAEQEAKDAQAKADALKADAETVVPAKVTLPQGYDLKKDTETLKINATAQKYSFDSYKNASKSDRETIIDLKNLTTDQIRELSEYAAQIINDIRKQYATSTNQKYNPIRVNDTSIAIVRNVANNYVKDNWYAFEPGDGWNGMKAHDDEALNNANIGVNTSGGWSSENMSDVSQNPFYHKVDGNLVEQVDDSIFDNLKDSETTMAIAKENIFTAIQSMTLSSQELEHATNVIIPGNSLGVTFSWVYSDYVSDYCPQLHFVTSITNSADTSDYVNTFEKAAAKDPKQAQIAALEAQAKSANECAKAAEAAKVKANITYKTALTKKAQADYQTAKAHYEAVVEAKAQMDKLKEDYVIKTNEDGTVTAVPKTAPTADEKPVYVLTPDDIAKGEKKVDKTIEDLNAINKEITDTEAALETARADLQENYNDPQANYRLHEEITALNKKLEDAKVAKDKAEKAVIEAPITADTDKEVKRDTLTVIKNDAEQVIKDNDAETAKIKELIPQHEETLRNTPESQRLTRARLEGTIENLKNELKQLESTKANAESKKNGAIKALAALDKPVTSSETPSDKPSEITSVAPSEKPSATDDTKPNQTVTADTVANQTVDAKATTNGQVSVQTIQAAYNKVTTQKETDKVLDRRGIPTYKAATSLPTTGDKESTTFAILGMTLLSLGAIGMKKRKI